MVEEIDVRGLGCPIPVVRTKKALESMEEGELTVIIERPDGCENVKRFAESQGCNCEVLNYSQGKVIEKIFSLNRRRLQKVPGIVRFGGEGGTRTPTHCCTRS